MTMYISSKIHVIFFLLLLLFPPNSFSTFIVYLQQVDIIVLNFLNYWTPIFHFKYRNLVYWQNFVRILDLDAAAADCIYCFSSNLFIFRTLLFSSLKTKHYHHSIIPGWGKLLFIDIEKEEEFTMMKNVLRSSLHGRPRFKREKGQI